MTVDRMTIPDVRLFRPRVFDDSRGFFLESFNQKQFETAFGRNVSFVQDKHSQSVRNVLRGLHYQIRRPQGKLIRVTRGTVFDVAVDLRRSSSTFGQWVGAVLSEENKMQIWIPEGFAHGFLVLSDTAEVMYKTTDYYDPAHERAIRWDDPTLAIDWPLEGEPIVSDKDSDGARFTEAEVFD